MTGISIFTILFFLFLVLAVVCLLSGLYYKMLV